MAEHRILVVDDDPDIVCYLASLLSDHGYETRCAGDTTAAHDLLQDFGPHLVIIDVLMPGRSGLDLLVSMRSSAEWSHIPVVLVTGHDQVASDYCRTYLRQHPHVRAPESILTKPIDREELLSTVRSLV